MTFIVFQCSIAIFRIAPASWERALSAQTPLDPYGPFSVPPGYKADVLKHKG